MQGCVATKARVRMVWELEVILCPIFQRWTGTPGGQIRPALEKKLCCLECVFLCCKAQRGCATICFRVYSCPLGTQECDACWRVAVSSIVQGRPSRGMSPRIRIGIIFQQECNTFCFVLKWGPVKGCIAMTIGAPKRSEKGMGCINSIVSERTGSYKRSSSCLWKMCIRKTYSSIKNYLMLPNDEKKKISKLV